MGYEAAIKKSWDELIADGADKEFTVRFLSDRYSIDPRVRKVSSLSCNVPAKDFTAIIILHYALRARKGLPKIGGEWLTFRELAGIEGYYQAFRKRSILPIIRKYGSNAEGILTVLERLPGKRVEGGDFGIEIDALDGVPALIKIWQADEEFDSDANIYFDKSVTGIFCTEDIVVLAGLISSAL